MTFKQQSILRIRELKVLLLLIAAYVVSFCRRDKQLWLIAERGTDARDNGFWLFRYIKEKQPGIRVKYVISRNSPDLNKLADYCNCLVETGSFQHYVLLWRAECLISTHIQGFTPFPDLFASINRRVGIWKNKKVVFLQHGITKDLLPQLFYTNTRLDLFICGAEPEYRFVCREFGYSDDKVAYTGLCRYDGLNDYRVKEQILIMPTWRQWLKSEDFEKSEYFEIYSRLLCDSRLQALLSETGLSVVFYPHHEIQSQLDSFQALGFSDKIVIANAAHYDVQQLLKESKLLITDYSSVFFDFAYMHKPIQFFQFDEKRFRQSHYQEGYFDFNHGFGPVARTVDELIEHLIMIVRSGFTLYKEHEDNVTRFFPLRDTNNCNRVFEQIKRING